MRTPYHARFDSPALARRRAFAVRTTIFGVPGREPPGGRAGARARVTSRGARALGAGRSKIGQEKSTEGSILESASRCDRPRRRRLEPLYAELLATERGAPTRADSARRAREA